MSDSVFSPEYENFLADLKGRIQAAQVRAASAVNSELVMLYWHIGRGIVQRQQNDGWGAKVIDRLSADLRQAFPEMKGFSARNLKYMRAFAVAWPDELFVQQVAAQIPWFHNCMLLDKLKDPETRAWYARAAIEFGWSRNILALQIDSALHRRQGQAITNFARTLPEPRSELAQNLQRPLQF